MNEIRRLQAMSTKEPHLSIGESAQENTGQINKSIRIKCKSLGDLLQVPVLLSILKGRLSGFRLADLILEEEYHDFSGILQVLRDKYCASTTNKYNKSHPIYTIGCYDTNVVAYSNQRGDYDFVFPAQFLRALNVTTYSEFDIFEIRRALKINESQRVIVLGSFSATEVGLPELRGVSAGVANDFISTNQARYVPPERLSASVKLLLKDLGFDVVYLVPRNISEEKTALDLMKKSLGGCYLDELIKGDATTSANSVIVDAKGVLKAIYAVSHCAIVFGLHNVLEPYFANPNCRILCFEPPVESPNRLFWECGNRLGLISSIGSVFSGFQENRLTTYFDARTEMSREDSIYFGDSLFINSMSKVMNLVNDLWEEIST